MGKPTNLSITISFYTYEMCTTFLQNPHDVPVVSAWKTLLCGGLAGCATWSSIFPLDVIKTRIQTQTIACSQNSRFERARKPVDQSLHILSDRGKAQKIVGKDICVAGYEERTRVRGATVWEFGKMVWRTEGVRGLFRGFWVCNVRAFIVNAIQWSVYEGAMRIGSAE